MLFEIIHKPEASYLCCYRKKIILNRLEDFLALNFCAQILSMSEIIVKFSRLSKVEQSKILDNIIVIGIQLSNQRTR